MLFLLIYCSWLARFPKPPESFFTLFNRFVSESEFVIRLSSQQY